MYLIHHLGGNIFLKLLKKASCVANILHALNSYDINLYMRAFDAYVKQILQYCSIYGIQIYVKI